MLLVDGPTNQCVYEEYASYVWVCMVEWLGSTHVFLQETGLQHSIDAGSGNPFSFHIQSTLHSRNGFGVVPVTVATGRFGGPPRAFRLFSQGLVGRNDGHAMGQPCRGLTNGFLLLLLPLVQGRIAARSTARVSGVVSRPMRGIGRTRWWSFQKQIRNWTGK